MKLEEKKTYKGDFYARKGLLLKAKEIFRIQLISYTFFFISLRAFSYLTLSYHCFLSLSFLHLI